MAKKKEVKKESPKKENNRYGHIVFGVAFLIAILNALFQVENVTYNKAVIVVLVLSGLIIGALNVTRDEVTQFLVSTVAFIVVLYSSQILVGLLRMANNEYLINAFQLFVGGLISVLVPATFIVSLISLFRILRD